MRGARDIVLCADDRRRELAADAAEREVLRYGFDVADARLVARGLESRAEAARSTVVLDDDCSDE